MQLSIIATAVNNRQILTFNYDEKPRAVEPHAVGFNAKGDMMLRAYQIDGESCTNPKAWKLFSGAKITDLEIMPINFAKAREGYKKGDRVMDTIVAQLDEA